MDVLESGNERNPRFTGAARRRLRLGSVALIVTFAAAAAGLEVQERRDAATEERRLAGLLRLSASDTPPLGVYFTAVVALPAFDMYVDFLVRNDGPRDVTVTHASAGEFGLLRAPVTLAAQTTAQLTLQQKVQCSADTLPPSQPPPPDDQRAAPGPLEITARTSGGTRTITIAQPHYYTEFDAFTCEALRANPPPGVPPPE